jgi:hypothetical protein
MVKARQARAPDRGKAEDCEEWEVFMGRELEPRLGKAVEA